MKESNDVKIYLIGEVVQGKKESKVLAEKEVNQNSPEHEEVF